MNENNNIEKKIIYICKNQYAYFLQKANVVGLGLGYKVTKGFDSNNLCIKVFVVKKFSKDELRVTDLIPIRYKGMLTDVVEGGIITASSFTNKIRPVYGGYSIGPVKGSLGGTMGCVVKDKKYKYILGNAHVIASGGNIPLATSIIQPALADKGSAPEDTVGTLSKYIKLNYKGGANYVDGAIAKIIDEHKVSSSLAIVGNIHGVSIGKLKEKVQKVGRTTELMKGEIVALGVTATVQFSMGTCLFKDIIVTSKISESGDSGAILLDDETYALGICFAESDSYSYANPIRTVLSMLNVTIVKD